MKITPTLEECKNIAAEGDYGVIPISTELYADMTTPIEVLRILKKVSGHVYLLESAEADKRWGRYSFLGYDPLLEITCYNGMTTIKSELTSRTDSMDELTGILKGADDYITKPFNPPILLARIGVVLKRTTDKNAEKSRGNALNMEYKGVILNVVGGCIEHEGKKTDLTKNELKILHLLYQKKGEIVPRMDMIEYLWDNEVFIDDNTLSVNVTRLRGKLADIGVKDFIETKRGMGYRI